MIDLKALMNACEKRKVNDQYIFYLQNLSDFSAFPVFQRFLSTFPEDRPFTITVTILPVFNLAPDNKQLIIKGNFNVTWPVLGTTSEVTHTNKEIKIDNALLEITVTVLENNNLGLDIGAKTPGTFDGVLGTIGYDNDNLWTFSLMSSGSFGEKRFDEAILLVGGNPELLQIPSFEENIFSNIAIKNFIVGVDPKNIQPSSLNFSAQSDETKTWELIKLNENKSISLKKVGFEYLCSHQSMTDNTISTSFGGNIHGTLDIADKTLEVILHFQADDYFKIEIISDIQEGFLNIQSLAELFGGHDLVVSMQNIGFNFSITDINIDFDLKEKRFTELYIESYLTIKDIKIEIIAWLPDFRFSGMLASEIQLDFKSLFEKYNLPTVGIPNITIDELRIDAAPKDKAYGFWIDIYTDWDIIKLSDDNYFSLENINININYANEKVFGSISATIAIADVEILLSASRPETGGWEFRGNTLEHSKIPIGDLIEKLSQKIGNNPDIKLPAPLKSLEIENLGMSFLTSEETKDFKVYGELKFKIEDKEVDLKLSIEICKKADKYKADFGGELVIRDLVFDVRFSGNADDNYFIATYSHTEGIIEKETLSTLISDPDGLFTDLINKRYINDQGTLQDEFKKLTYFSEMNLDTKYQSNKEKIFNALRNCQHKDLNIKELIKKVSTDFAEIIPDDLEIGLKDVLFCFRKDNAKKGFVLGIDISTNINLSHFPLIGQVLPPDKSVSVNDLQVLILSNDFTQTEIGNFNNLLPPSVTRLPVRDSSRGIEISAEMKLGEEARTLTLPISSHKSTPAKKELFQLTTPGLLGNDGAITSDSTKWFNLKKSLGPIYFDKIGVTYRQSKVWCLVDASFSLSVFKIDLEGFNIRMPLNVPLKVPDFGLEGLALTYKMDPLEISGGFRNIPLDPPDFRFDGEILIKANAFSFSAIGSYANYQGNTSLFIFALLNYPLGGPSFFFVTGLAGGFGYNSKLNLPDIDGVADFSLVKAVFPSKNPFSKPNDLAQVMQSMGNDICFSCGEYWIAAGVKFSSFELIQSFVLLNVQFGNSLEIALLGLSQLSIPTKIPQPIAYAELAIEVYFSADKGILEVCAKLTSASYIFSKDCHLTGGFAFYLWFKGTEAGDFVVTLGGYHPHFVKPDHYPLVPRLGLNWTIGDLLTIKGGIYFALTPNALMAGGALEVLFHCSALDAWLIAYADFLLAWKPFHYEVAIGVSIGVSVHLDIWITVIRFTLQLGAQLEFWGPEFAGKVCIQLWIIDITISFGDSNPGKQPIEWEEFKVSFLPKTNLPGKSIQNVNGAETLVCNIKVIDGLIKEISSDKKDNDNIDWLIKPENFNLLTNSSIPSKNASFNNKDQKIKSDVRWNENFGVAPVDIKPEEIETVHKIILAKFDENQHTFIEYSDESSLEITPIIRKMPAALWGIKLQQELNDDRLIDNALVGFNIISKKPIAEKTLPVNLQKLLFNPQTLNFNWQRILDFPEKSDYDQKQAFEILKSTIKENSDRENILTQLKSAQHLESNYKLQLTHFSTEADSFLVAKPQLCFLDENKEISFKTKSLTITDEEKRCG